MFCSGAACDFQGRMSKMRELNTKIKAYLQSPIDMHSLDLPQMNLGTGGAKGVTMVLLKW
jgi:hypothetical protein